MKHITKKNIRNAFAKAEKNQEFCWTVLVDLKQLRSGADDFTGRLIRFQDVLATTIFNLQFIRDQIISEEKYIVSRKKHYQQKWFVARLRQLSSFKEAIDQVVNMCKALGDAYAYFFYRNDTALFTQHLGHERVINHTAGDGERGELEFIRKVKHFKGCFTLYHGITNILRYGDFSFIDLHKFKVVYIGELKSSRTDDQTISSRLHIISRNLVKRSREKKVVDEEMSQTRRGRQLLGIINLLKGNTQPTGPVKSIYRKNYVDEVNQLFQRSKVNEEEFVQVSPGLTFFLLRFRKVSLYHKMFKRKFNVIGDDTGEKLAETVKKMIRKDSDNNGIIMSMLIYFSDLSLRAIPGTIPIFWSPVDDEALKILYLQNGALFTLFNPQHLIGDLKDMGIGVISKYAEPPAKTGLTKKVIQDFDLFLPYIVNHLFSEDFVVDAIKSVINYGLKNGKQKTFISIQQQSNIFEGYLRNQQIKKNKRKYNPEQPAIRNDKRIK